MAAISFDSIRFVKRLFNAPVSAFGFSIKASAITSCRWAAPCA
ncbi:hypothetical protein C7S17_6735 [Burkholderia thailandensis]|nr:hypothetical protein [Burkholderia thailandensis]